MIIPCVSASQRRFDRVERILFRVSHLLQNLILGPRLNYRTKLIRSSSKH